MLVPLGGSFTSSTFCTPNAWVIEPANRLNFIASISENDSNSTKKHISSDIKSAKVPIHAGDPGGGQSGQLASSLFIRPAANPYGLAYSSAFAR
jgi:hypothetical protein